MGSPKRPHSDIPDTKVEEWEFRPDMHISEPTLQVAFPLKLKELKSGSDHDQGESGVKLSLRLFEALTSLQGHHIHTDAQSLKSKLCLYITNPLQLQPVLIGSHTGQAGEWQNLNYRPVGSIACA